MTAVAALPGPTEPVDLADFPNLFDPLKSWFDAYGDVVRFETTDGGVGFSIARPELAAPILLENAPNYERGYGVERVRMMLPGGMLVDEGHRWRRQRKMAQPLFRRPALEALGALAADEARRSRDAWIERARSGEEIDLLAELSTFALRFVLGALFGPNDAARSPLLELASAGARDLAFARRFRAFRPHVAELVARRQAASGASAGDFVDMLLGAPAPEEAPYSSDEYVDQILTLIVAGHETTANALAWTYLLLAAHPEEARRLHADPERRREPVMKEALRLYPPVWLLTRRAIAANRVDGIDIPAGAQVFVPLFLLLRHPSHWDAPERFDPERFTRAHAPFPPLAYEPFGVGPRRCIGERLALLQMKAHLTAVTPVLELQRDGAMPDPEAQVNLRPGGRIVMRPELRRRLSEPP